jgi:hypothetical protein
MSPYLDRPGYLSCEERPTRYERRSGTEFAGRSFYIVPGP